MTHTHTHDYDTYKSMHTYDRTDIDCLCMEALRNDTGYYNDEDYRLTDTSDILHTLETWCDTL